MTAIKHSNYMHGAEEIQVSLPRNSSRTPRFKNRQKEYNTTEKWIPSTTAFIRSNLFVIDSASIKGPSVPACRDVRLC